MIIFLTRIFTFWLFLNFSVIPLHAIEAQKNTSFSFFSFFNKETIRATFLGTTLFAYWFYKKPKVHKNPAPTENEVKPYKGALASIYQAAYEKGQLNNKTSMSSTIGGWGNFLETLSGIKPIVYPDRLSQPSSPQTISSAGAHTPHYQEMQPSSPLPSTSQTPPGLSTPTSQTSSPLSMSTPSSGASFLPNTCTPQPGKRVSRRPCPNTPSSRKNRNDKPKDQHVSAGLAGHDSFILMPSQPLTALGLMQQQNAKQIRTQTNKKNISESSSTSLSNAASQSNSSSTSSPSVSAQSVSSLTASIHSLSLSSSSTPSSSPTSSAVSTSKSLHDFYVTRALQCIEGVKAEYEYHLQDMDTRLKRFNFFLNEAGVSPLSKSITDKTIIAIAEELARKPIPEGIKDKQLFEELKKKKLLFLEAVQKANAINASNTPSPVDMKIVDIKYAQFCMENSNDQGLNDFKELVDAGRIGATDQCATTSSWFGYGARQTLLDIAKSHTNTLPSKFPFMQKLQYPHLKDTENAREGAGNKNDQAVVIYQGQDDKILHCVRLLQGGSQNFSTFEELVRKETVSIYDTIELGKLIQLPPNHPNQTMPVPLSDLIVGGSEHSSQKDDYRLFLGYIAATQRSINKGIAADSWDYAHSLRDDYNTRFANIGTLPYNQKLLWQSTPLSNTASLSLVMSSSSRSTSNARSASSSTTSMVISTPSSSALDNVD